MLIKNVYLLIFLLLFSCQQEDVISFNSAVSKKNDFNTLAINEMREKAGDIVYDENNIDELFSRLDSITTMNMNKKGYMKIEDITHIQPRYSIDDFTYHASYGKDYYRIVEGQNYVKIKMYTELADAINNAYSGSSFHPIKRNKTYICAWRYLEVGVKLGVNQYFSPVKSPKCALKPSNRQQLWNCYRDYEAYETSSGGNVCMLSYVLEIKCLDSDDIFNPGFTHYWWPREEKSEYLFNYSILTL